MKLRILAAGILVIVFSLHTPVMSAMYKIDNPADKIKNPADKIYDPATQTNNPASNIHNPAAQMDNPNPQSPPAQPVPQPKIITTNEQIKVQPNPQPKLTIPHKSYHFKTVGTYITAAKKAFNQDDYLEFLSITEDALRRISAGTLKASKTAKQKLAKYKVFGYGLLEKIE